MATEISQEIKSVLTFSVEAETEFQKITGKYPNQRAALLPVLYLAQKEFGYLRTEVIEYVAERLDLPASKVLQVATFYTMYAKRPIGEHWIEVCTSVPCCAMGGYKLLRHLEETLGVKAGGTTKDKKFTLTEAECLAGCGRAPLLQVDSLYHEHLGTLDDNGEMQLDTDEKIDEILASYE